MKKLFVFIVILSILLTPKIQAQSIENGVDIALGMVPDSITQELQKSGVASIVDLIKAPPSTILKILQQEATKSIRLIASTLSMVIAIILLTTVVTSLSVGSDNSIENMIGLTCCLWIIFVLSKAISGCILEGISAVSDCTKFMLSYIPVYAGVSAAAGLPASSLVYHTMLMGVGQVISQVTQNILSPLICVFLSLSLSGVISDNKGLMNISSALKKMIIWMLTLGMTVFVGFATMQSFIAGITDLSVGKTTKFLVGSFVPVVGGVISDAVSVVIGSMGVIKATVGSIGILVTLMFFFPILLKITIWRVAIYFGFMVGEVMGMDSCAKVLTAFNDTLVILSAIILSVALLFIISTGVILSLGVM